MDSSQNPGKNMPFIGHLKELRNRILASLACCGICAAIAYVFSDRIIELFTRQFENIASAIESSLVVTTIAEGFVARIKIAALAGFIFSLPVHVLNLLGFVFPGLERKHRLFILAFTGASAVLIIAGSYLAYFHILPLAIQFLANPNFVPSGVGYLLSYQANIFYILSFILWALVALQLPLVLEILLILNVLKRKTVFNASRYIIVAIFVLSAVLTPPDFISQLGVAFPLIAMYFLVILVAKVFRFGEQ